MKNILFLIGSESDKKQVQPGMDLIAEKGLTADLKVFSAHRNLPELLEFLRKEEHNYQVILAAAGLSAALPGVVASQTSRPVLGIPLVAGPLQGTDAVLSILQLPKGTPAATMGLGKHGILNAVHLAERIIKLTR